MNPSATRLSAVTRELLMQWQQTKESWRDSKAAEFDRKYMQELFATVDKSLASIEQLDKLLSKIRRECE
jgi:hypothetical protein